MRSSTVRPRAAPNPGGSDVNTAGNVGNTPGLPPQVYEVPAPTPSPYPYALGYAYPDYFPYWWGSPGYFGLAPSIFIVQRFNRFHHGFHHGFHRGFHRGLARGSGRSGFGHGFAAARAGSMGGRR